ncbi:MAG: gamma-glutamyl-gamma-aminobutyrate hydrolase family protein [Chlamydiae bacterium]|nr:gamma-glutamyl-gamma-aminobutyrate hydrolase family protein [Chlamydiota bacterium]MBI3266090.1 gamma-glutamyl-gamma-aminobutyrate hydrolase family protein [Chlamydiota bacterium]
MKPEIAILTGLEKPPEKPYPDAVTNYFQAVSDSGGEPRLLSPLDASSASPLSYIHGLLLTGGGDIPSYFWGEKSDIPPKSKDERRAKFEIPLIRQAAQQKIPILGICLGLQAINVAFGGSLYTDFTTTAHSQLHCRKLDGSSSYHKIEVLEKTKLREILPPVTEVNSRHHQAIKRLGKGLQICAVAQDGIIEGIEGKDFPWLIGVQWHPEDLFQDHPTQHKIFEKFVEACRKYET